LNYFTRLLIPKKKLFQLPLGSWAFFCDDHREQIINNLSDEDIPFPAAPQIPGQNTPKPSTSICI
jgi:hypothetical protein